LFFKIGFQNRISKLDFKESMDFSLSSKIEERKYKKEIKKEIKIEIKNRKQRKRPIRCHIWRPKMPTFHEKIADRPFKLFFNIY
jgi:hypothetical protein